MKKVALALASGGPRGFAYIGAIEELLARGYEITSIAGVSAGSLVGGIYAAGGLQAFKEWLFGLDPVKVVSLMDFSVSRNYLVKGDKVINAIKERVPNVNIEDLPIPFTAVATDLFTGEEVIFREGPLFDAIRASISIPSMFRPVKWKGRTLVDGGMVNTFPLNRVARTPGDILVGFNVNQIDAAEIQGFLDSRAALVQDRDSLPLRDRLVTDLQELRLMLDGRENRLPVTADATFSSILQRSFGIMNCTIARMGIALTPPDILVDLPFDSYHGVYGYSHAEEIAEKGRQLMAEALDAYEAEK
ncbi:MAG: patatin-like phospholipase family protein [Bacteroidales bacterium]|nr:patatin-like phospholipase family protein [Bacteroidales bacterium]